jgi:hypothetical protein
VFAVLSKKKVYFRTFLNPKVLIVTKGTLLA